MQDSFEPETPTFGRKVEFREDIKQVVAQALLNSLRSAKNVSATAKTFRHAIDGVLQPISFPTLDEFWEVSESYSFGMMQERNVLVIRTYVRCACKAFGMSDYAVRIILENEVNPVIVREVEEE